jgi:hypothetical protein
VTHLSPETFVDLLEGAIDERAASHLASCAACRAQLAELRSTWQVTVDAEMPEPSPLFWDHLSARIREAVASEPAHRGWLDTFGWRWGIAGVLSAAVAAVALIAVLDTGRPEPAAGSNAAVTQASVSDASSGPAADPLADDESLGFVADLASNIDWDESGGLGLAARGAADVAVAGLNDDERMELQRLLHEALGQQHLL